MFDEKLVHLHCLHMFTMFLLHFLKEEIQSFHFGAARRQVCLHTGVLHLYKENPICFCCISPCCHHGPAAIWAHLQPLLTEIRATNPTVSVLHFFSDGPSSQYRQKNNFYLFSTQLHDLGFHGGTWNFFEAGHGKNAADGVGAVAKRTADMEVAHGIDIPDAATLFKVLKNKESNVKFFYIPEQDVDMEAKILKSIKPIPGTQKIHQIATNRRGEIFYRHLSCFCSKNNWEQNSKCNCNFQWKQAIFEQPTLPKEEGDHTHVASTSKDDMHVKVTQKNQKKKQKKKQQKRKRKGSSSESETEDEMEEIAYADSSGDEQCCDLLEEEKSNRIVLEDQTMDVVTKTEIKPGVYMLIKVVGGKRMTTNYRYVAVCQAEPDVADGAVCVMFMKAFPAGDTTLFKPNESDVHFCDFDSIIRILPSPTLELVRHTVCFRFPLKVPVFEK